MKISYLGHSAFKIETEGKTIITDPFKPEMLDASWKEEEADIVLVSHEHEDHNYVEGVTGDPFVVRTPGEYEIAGIRIQGISSYHDAEKGQERGTNTMYVIEAEDMFVAHLGDLGHELDEEQEEQLGEVDILMIPVSGVFTITPQQASTMIPDLEPKIVIPMHYPMPGTKGEEWGLAPLDEFLKEMGAEEVEPRKNLDIKDKGKLPEEMEVVVLEVGK